MDFTDDDGGILLNLVSETVEKKRRRVRGGVNQKKAHLERRKTYLKHKANGTLHNKDMIPYEEQEEAPPPSQRHQPVDTVSHQLEWEKSVKSKPLDTQKRKPKDQKGPNSNDRKAAKPKRIRDSGASEEERVFKQAKKAAGEKLNVKTKRGSWGKKEEEQMEEASLLRPPDSSPESSPPASPRALDDETLERIFGSTGVVGQASTFQDLGLPSRLTRQIQERLGFSGPTQVQQRAIPPLIHHKDLMVRAETGSGKTLAYLAPMLGHLGEKTPRVERGDGTRGLVLVPTRELCLQVLESLQALLSGPYHFLTPGAVFGGENRAHEKARLRKGIVVLVASPGRLLDHLKMTAAFRVDQLAWLVVDEADRLLDLGFEETISEILRLLDKKKAEGDAGALKRTTVLLSATLHSQLHRLARLSMRSPLTIGFSLEGPQPSVPDASKSGNGVSHDGLGATHGRFSDDEEDKEDGEDSEDDEDENEKAEDNEDPEEEDDEESGGGKAAPVHVHSDVIIPKQVRQLYCEAPASMRSVLLVSLLRHRLTLKAARDMKPQPKGNPTKTPDIPAHKVVVFFSTTASVDFHHSLIGKLQSRGQPLVPAKLFHLHGSLPQAERSSSFNAFKSCSKGVLLTTDVAARGLDFPAVDLVIQVDPTPEVQDYIHRVGRTGRLGQQGEAVLMLQPHECRGYLHHLSQAAGVTPQQAKVQGWLGSLPALADDTAAAPHSFRADHLGDNRNPKAAAMLGRIEAAVSSHSDLSQLAVEGFQAFTRAYATFPKHLKPVFNPQALHLGHVARSFGLQKAPSTLNRASSKPAKRVSEKTRMDQLKAKAKGGKMNSRLNFSHQQKATGPSSGKIRQFYTSE